MNRNNVYIIATQKQKFWLKLIIIFYSILQINLETIQKNISKKYFYSCSKIE